MAQTHGAVVRQQVQIAAAQPGSRKQQHDQPVPNRLAGREQRDNLLVARPVHTRPVHTGIQLLHAVSGAQPMEKPTVLALCLQREVTVVG
jgi:hypothetical protein